MKIALTGIVALTSLGLLADEPASTLEKHHFSIGPTLIKPKLTYLPKYAPRWSIQRNDLDQMFYGLKFEYEYLSEDAFYFGADIHSGIHQCSEEGDSSLGKVDMRFGYTLPFMTLFDKHWDVSVFTGFGGYAWKDSFNDSYDMPFWHIGMRTRLIQNESMNMGLTMKWMTFQDTHEANRGKFFGAEVGLPFTFKPLQSGWEFTLAPNFLYMCRTTSQNVMHYEMKATRRF